MGKGGENEGRREGVRKGQELELDINLVSETDSAQSGSKLIM